MAAPGFLRWCWNSWCFSNLDWFPLVNTLPSLSFSSKCTFEYSGIFFVKFLQQRSCTFASSTPRRLGTYLCRIFCEACFCAHFLLTAIVLLPSSAWEIRVPFIFSITVFMVVENTTRLVVPSELKLLIPPFPSFFPSNFFSLESFHLNSKPFRPLAGLWKQNKSFLGPRNKKVCETFRGFPWPRLNYAKLQRR